MDDQSKRKKSKKVVTGPVARRKKKQHPAEESLAITAGYVFTEVLLPAFRDMLYDGIVAGAGKIIYPGTDRPHTRSSRPQTGVGVAKGSYTSYNRYSDKKRSIGEPKEGVRPSKRARSQHDFDEFVLSTRKEAVDIIDSMFEDLLDYEVVTVSDLYDKLGVTPQYTDDNWGWTDIRGADVKRIRGGYVLSLPQPKALD